MIRSSGIGPNIIHYLDTPPDRDVLIKLIAKMKITVRDLLRKNVEPYKKLELDSGRFTDTQLIYFMLKYPLLINRPIVVTPLGVKLCRPSDVRAIANMRSRKSRRQHVLRHQRVRR